jgi:hypothetical protein
MKSRQKRPIHHFGMAFIFLLVIPSPFLCYATRILGDNVFHRVQWQLKGSENYEIKTDLNDFSPIRGTSILTVNNGEITKVDVVKSTYPYDPSSMHSYYVLTIDGMFQKIFTCLNEYPRLICSFKYDPEYGFPTWVNVNCPNPDTCYESYETIDVEYVKVWK